MNFMTTFLYEWRHFIRAPFKIIAMLLFVVASIYALQNGASLYHKQTAEIEKIEEKALEDIETNGAYYDNGEKGPASQPWVDLTTPFWAVRSTPVHAFKKPSAAIVYNIGQAEQYGFYKRVGLGSSPYDSDMAEEIANPERLQSGTLDFSFVILYLLPLLLLVCLYNIKGSEADKGFLSLVYAQTGSEFPWLLARVSFYGLIVAVGVLGLMTFGASLTGVFQSAASSFFSVFYWLMIYLVFWLLIYVLILRNGNSVLGNTLKMLGVWLLFAFIMPATIHQWVSTQYPAGLMTEFIDAHLDETDKLFEEPDSILQAQLISLYPEIATTKAIQEGARIAKSRTVTPLSNQLVKESIQAIENNNESRNKLIKATSWVNPVTFMQNKLNALSKTHYQDYKNYRDEIQTMIDKQLKLMVVETYNDVVVDKERYMEYNEALR